MIVAMKQAEDEFFNIIHAYDSPDACTVVFDADVRIVHLFHAKDCRTSAFKIKEMFQSSRSLIRQGRWYSWFVPTDVGACIAKLNACAASAASWSPELVASANARAGAITGTPPALSAELSVLQAKGALHRWLAEVRETTALIEKRAETARNEKRAFANLEVEKSKKRAAEKRESKDAAAARPSRKRASSQTASAAPRADDEAKRSARQKRKEYEWLGEAMMSVMNKARKRRTEHSPLRHDRPSRMERDDDTLYG